MAKSLAERYQLLPGKLARALDRLPAACEAAEPPFPALTSEFRATFRARSFVDWVTREKVGNEESYSLNCTATR